jgi:predicted DsbA family dithiol-disulfide isomerase
MEPQIEITEFTDPYCTWCWGSEPVLRHVLEAYDDRDVWLTAVPSVRRRFRAA